MAWMKANILENALYSPITRDFRKIVRNELAEGKRILHFNHHSMPYKNILKFRTNYYWVDYIINIYWIWILHNLWLVIRGNRCWYLCVCIYTSFVYWSNENEWLINIVDRLPTRTLHLYSHNKINARIIHYSKNQNPFYKYISLVSICCLALALSTRWQELLFTFPKSNLQPIYLFI